MEYVQDITQHGDTMKLFKDYTEDFEKTYEKIEEIKDFVRGKNDKTLIALNEIEKTTTRLENQYDLLHKEIIEIKQIIMNQIPKGFATEEISIDSDENEKRKGGHISTYKHFDNYRTPRKYDLVEQVFRSPNGNHPIRLTFEQLIALIQAYRSGLQVKQINNPILKGFPSYALQNYIYIYRAGGFNKAILEHGRKLGYNPQKWISMEVKENV